MKKFANGAYMVIVFTLIIALLGVIVMCAADRLYGSTMVANAIDSIEDVERQESIVEAFEANRFYLNKIGAAARTFIPWNDQPAELYEESNYVLCPDLAE